MAIEISIPFKILKWNFFFKKLPNRYEPTVMNTQKNTEPVKKSFIFHRLLFFSDFRSSKNFISPWVVCPDAAKTITNETVVITKNCHQYFCKTGIVFRISTPGATKKIGIISIKKYPVSFTAETLSKPDFRHTNKITIP